MIIPVSGCLSRLLQQSSHAHHHILKNKNIIEFKDNINSKRLRRSTSIDSNRNNVNSNSFLNFEYYQRPFSSSNSSSNSSISNNIDSQQQLPLQPVIPTNCCGNGCAHCVWDSYFDELEQYNLKMKEINPNLPDEPLLTSDENEDPMQFFMKMERFFALQKKKQEQQQKLKQEKQDEQLKIDIGTSIASS
ncbi:hypothetical protein PPL_11192 [Heterostelium album PN500]|uniref:Oxidoreductase-like domain-containing protein n=1 Tax=Heterostelium pallidum (strain ATCC 26659 / Pp 5 / PN500) TaxID=670386 RepID=D3BTT2_HETP5|nr:hypothetical protein PPL_11192 [Heterostelium album PN500]EFA75118.1 hypothetical protein PPL_11192 [Heterostelium album PN500]|eukprot:XP_020427252.1 hypothetical protein PPL_11192 [Heterostelium album PN500]